MKLLREVGRRRAMVSVHLERQQPNKKPTLKTESWLLRRFVLSNSPKSNDGSPTVLVGERAQQGSTNDTLGAYMGTNRLVCEVKRNLNQKLCHNIFDNM